MCVQLKLPMFYLWYTLIELCDMELFYTSTDGNVVNPNAYAFDAKIVDNTYNGKAVVNVMGRSLTLLNKTGEILKQGDGVIIHYWDNVANGYIALRCGLPNPAGGLNIENAVVSYESIAKVNNISKSVEKV